jgi:outer membrane receptor for ferrienterochelin and colicin
MFANPRCPAVVLPLILIGFSFCRISTATVGATTHQDAAVRGRVLDGRTGQPIDKARVSTAAVTTSTDGEGRFSLVVTSDASTEMTISAVGYGRVRRTVIAGPDELTVYLAQDTVAHSERVEVRPALFEADPDEPLAHTLQNVELRNLAGVATDDVLRAVQGLPGVAAGDDFYGTFSVRGWGFQNTGLYLDGVLVNSPFHTIRDLNDAYSLSILNNDLIDGVTMLNGAAPARYGDRVGGVLSLDTRDGSRDETRVRASLGITGASLVAEGPIGSSGASWLLSARKSFLDYVVKAIQDTPSFVIGHTDLQAKLSHRAGARALSLFMLHGTSDYEDSSPGLPRNDVAAAAAATQLLNARWVWSPSSRTALTTAAFWTRETGDNRNARAEALFDTTSAQAGGRADLTRQLGSSHVLEAGLLARRLSGRQAEASFPRTGPATSAHRFDEASWQTGMYLQDGWKSRAGRVDFTLGVRVDRSSAGQGQQILPRASGNVRMSERSRVSFAAGGYAQFPGLDQLFGQVGYAGLVAERSDHITLGFEHRVSSTVRAQVQLYRQEERNRIGQSQLEPRLEGGRVVEPRNGTLQNAWSGTSRGVEAMLQRRSPNGVTGWVSYALARTELRDAVTGHTFDSDFDQRHTVNAYLSYRVSDRTNLSTKFRYGSNTPVAGYYEEADGDFRLSDERNLVRLPAYSRLDVRGNRTFTIGRARLTTYVEVLNLLNHSNYRYTGRSIFLPGGQVTFNRDTLFPILPAAGFTVEW